MKVDQILRLKVASFVHVAASPLCHNSIRRGRGGMRSHENGEQAGLAER
jgi:hypothetical protein